MPVPLPQQAPEQPWRRCFKQKKMAKISTDSIAVTKKNRPGTKAAKVNLGSTKSIAVVTKIVRLVSMDPLYTKFKNQLE